MRLSIAHVCGGYQECAGAHGPVVHGDEDGNDPLNFSIMVMHMVFFGVMMEMLMFDRNMVVPMRMFLGREYQCPCKHQTECNHYLQVRIFPEYEK